MHVNYRQSNVRISDPCNEPLLDISNPDDITNRIYTVTKKSTITALIQHLHVVVMFIFMEKALSYIIISGSLFLFLPGGKGPTYDLCSVLSFPIKMLGEQCRGDDGSLP